MVLVTTLVLSGCAERPVNPERVSIYSDSFIPPSLEIKIGTPVIWTNVDQKSNHQVRSITFNSQELSYGQTFTYTFTVRGVYDYWCGVDSTLVGKITVK